MKNNLVYFSFFIIILAFPCLNLESCKQINGIPGAEVPEDTSINVYYLRNYLESSFNFNRIENYRAAIRFQSDNSDFGDFYLEYAPVNSIAQTTYPISINSTHIVWDRRANVRFSQYSQNEWSDEQYLMTINGEIWNHFRCWPPEYYSDDYNIWNVFDLIQCGSPQRLYSNSSYEFVWNAVNVLTLYGANTSVDSDFRDFISFITEISNGSSKPIFWADSDITPQQFQDISSFFQFYNSTVSATPDIDMKSLIQQCLSHSGNAFYIRGVGGYYYIPADTNSGNINFICLNFTTHIPSSLYYDTSQIPFQANCFIDTLTSYHVGFLMIILLIVICLILLFYWFWILAFKKNKERIELEKVRALNKIQSSVPFVEKLGVYYEDEVIDQIPILRKVHDTIEKESKSDSFSLSSDSSSEIENNDSDKSQEQDLLEFK